MYGPYQCPLCQQAEETMSHLLHDCLFSADLWDHRAVIFRRSDRICKNPVGTLIHWPKNPFQSQLLNRIWEIFPNFFIWAIWNEHNAIIFCSRDLSLSIV